MSTHLSEFNSIFSQLVALKFIIDDEFKATFLLCTLPESWDTFRTAMSNSNAMLLYADVESSLLVEEMSRQNNASNKSSSALHMRGRSQQRGKSDSYGRSKSCGKDVECHHCGKKGHFKRDCFKWKKEKGKGKKIDDCIEEKRDIQPRKEVNVVTHDSDSGNDVLFVSSCHREHALLANTDGDMHTWILDSGASFHVTPHREWFSDYTGGRHGVVHLGDNYACEIVGIGMYNYSFSMVLLSHFSMYGMYLSSRRA